MSITVGDRLEIEDLAARYNLAIDLGDPDGWTACFRPDGVFAIAAVGSWTAATFGLTEGTWRGQHALREFAVTVAGATRCRHWSLNRVLTPVEAGIDAISYMNVCYLDRPPGEQLVTGVMRDHLVQDGGSWQFASRQISFDR